MTNNRFRLDKAIEQALDDIKALPEEEKILPQVQMAVRRCAPQTVKAVREVLEDNVWAFTLDTQPGRLVVDSISASISAFMLSAVLQKLQEDQQKQLEDQQRKEMVRLRLEGKR